MKRIMVIVFMGLALMAVVCSEGGTVNKGVKEVSLMQLIVDPEKYHGELVRVIGVSRIEFEGDSVWFTKEHYQHGIYRNSLWIEPDYDALGSTREQLEQFNGKYVLMEGYFNQDNHGHLGMYSGAIEKITRFKLWEKEQGTAQPSGTPSPTPLESGGVLPVQVDQPFSISIDQTAQLEESELNIIFKEVLEDSRCPSNVECAEAGQARILIAVYQTGQPAAALEMNSNPPLKQDVVTYGEFQIRLLTLDPYPEDIDQKIPMETYQATFIVTDLP